LNKINQDINIHAARRNEQVQKVQMKAHNEWQKVETVKMRNSPNKENNTNQSMDTNNTQAMSMNEDIDMANEDMN
jgi:hypothetical protein